MSTPDGPPEPADRPEPTGPAEPPASAGPGEPAEPSGAQGTGGSGQPVSDVPGEAMPKPTEDPGAVRRAEPEDEPAAEAPTESDQAPVGWLPRGAAALFGEGASAEEAYALLTVDVPAERWIASLETARDALGCTYFDWLSAVDEPGTGFHVCAHLVALPHEPGGDHRGDPGSGDPGSGVRRLVLRTTVPHEAPVLPTATPVYAGAAWHERETHEMFGVDFTGHPHLAPLLLPDAFEGHPLRKDFVLAARVAKAWPGAKEPGESEHGGPKRRQMLPPGVPDPNEWGPLKGQLPPAPARPARGRAAAGGDRPARRTRSASAGSASQTPTDQTPATGGDTGTPEASRPPRRSRSASEGSASQRPAGTAEPSAGGPAEPDPSERGAAAAPASRPPRRSRSASEGSASQRTAPPADEAGEPPGETPRPADAPWHHARPAFEEPEREPGSGADRREDDAAGPSTGEPRDERGAQDDETGGER
ncbi:NADH-quinone oxidoreductase subunit C [Streptomyces sp. DSM 42041]|uniref:NADH-quinone oxidoreductase subunit C n=1 Tax=Streptomyces hazeniae TaxID=3075538 RepID=A0ABU2NVR8_9ACTN|nr:NADH-quinone oxidoreductase subunit C [Streptomyces sp. DSM 42041]MDT0380617.1 NADH-quinone oxidoreductase subunit C [Streptomyces sp. DSM 42041]